MRAGTSAHLVDPVNINNTPVKPSEGPIRLYEPDRRGGDFHITAERVGTAPKTKPPKHV